MIDSGFWPRVRARVLQRTRLFGLINTPNRALRAPPPAHRSLAASPKIKKIVQKQNASLLARTWAARGLYLSTGPGGFEI